jgi:hypothetical protein
MGSRMATDQWGELKDRLKRIQDAFGYASITQLALACGLTRQALNGGGKRGSIGKEAGMALSRLTGVSLAWILYGEGDWGLRLVASEPLASEPGAPPPTSGPSSNDIADSVAPKRRSPQRSSRRLPKSRPDAR